MTTKLLIIMIFLIRSNQILNSENYVFIYTRTTVMCYIRVKLLLHSYS